MAKRKRDEGYDPLKDRSSVNYVQPDDLVEPIVVVDDAGNTERLEEVEAREVPEAAEQYRQERRVQPD